MIWSSSTDNPFSLTYWEHDECFKSGVHINVFPDCTAGLMPKINQEINC